MIAVDCISGVGTKVPVRLESEPPLDSEYRVHGPPRELERLSAPFARHLSRRAVSGHLGIRDYKVDTDTFVEVTKDELENVALESTRTIEIDEFVDRTEIDPRYRQGRARRLRGDLGDE
jgi:hypothetical protein